MDLHEAMDTTQARWMMLGRRIFLLGAKIIFFPQGLEILGKASIPVEYFFKFLKRQAKHFFHWKNGFNRNSFCFSLGIFHFLPGVGGACHRE